MGAEIGGLLGSLRRLLERSVPTTSEVEPSAIATPVAVRTEVQAAIFDPAETRLGIVGESYRQDALERVGQGRGPVGVFVPDQVAGLLPEPTNEEDPDAVQVQIDGRHVGYLRRSDARDYRPVLDRLASHGLYFACHAKLTGGWDRGAGDRGSIGVDLLIGSPADLWADVDREFGVEPPPAGLSTRPPSPRRAPVTPAPVGEWDGEWQGKTVCFTGPSGFAFHGDRITRQVQEVLATQVGLTVAPRITKRVHIVVVGAGLPLTSKVAKAASYGIAIVDEREFWKRIGVPIEPLR